MSAHAIPVDEMARSRFVESLLRCDIGSAIWKVRRRVAASGDLACLRRLLPELEIEQDDAGRLLGELSSSPALREALASTAAQAWNEATGDPDGRELRRRLEPRGSERGRALFLYVTIRLLRPETVVETGCFTGWDSMVILEALRRNGGGRLHTIDLPAETGRFSQVGARSGLPPGLSPGFLVPRTLRSRWSLTLGDVRDELLPLLSELGRVDLFFHDSHHSYSHMMWEYTSAWPYLRGGGVLVSDDVAWNTALWDFARGVGRRVVIHRSTPNVGALPC